jgi:hypothetical protein
MRFVRGVRETWQSAPHWLEVRDDRLFERRIVDAVIDRRGWADHVLVEGRTLGEERRRLSLAIADLENSTLRRLLVFGHDARIRLGGVLRKRGGLVLRRAPAGLGSGSSAPPSPPVAAIVHLFYPDLASEIRRYLEQIPRRTDLFISTDTDAKRRAIMAAFEGWNAGVEVRVAANRGRDIAPKLITFADVYARYELVLLLHGKKSVHSDHLRLWRYFALETLLPSKPGIEALLDQFDREPALGLVAPEPFRPVRSAMSWGGNFQHARALAQRMGFDLAEDAAPDFPAGSMFWARSAALRPLLDLGLREEDFPEEAGQGDGTLAHAIERLFFDVCESVGLRWATLARPDFAHPQVPQSTEAGSAEPGRTTEAAARLLIRP